MRESIDFCLLLRPLFFLQVAQLADQAHLAYVTIFTAHKSASVDIFLLHESALHGLSCCARTQTSILAH